MVVLIIYHCFKHFIFY